MISINKNESASEYNAAIDYLGISDACDADQHHKETYKSLCRPYTMELLESSSLDKVLKRAEGNFLYYTGTDGEEVEISDFVGGFGSNLLGHNYTPLTRRMNQLYSEKVPFSSQLSSRKHSAILARELNHILKQTFSREYIVTLASTGAEAVEAAVKHAELELAAKREKIAVNVHNDYYKVIGKMPDEEVVVNVPADIAELIELKSVSKDNLNGLYQRIVELNEKQLFTPSHFLALEGAFHGKTAAALSLTYNPAFKQNFDNIGARVKFLDTSESAFIKAIADSYVSYYTLEHRANQINIVENRFSLIAGIFIEPIQGENGIRPLDKKIAQTINKLSIETGTPLIVDEIQTGMGRTGTLLFSEQLNIVPDYLLLGKGLGGGVSKISALLVNRSQYVKEFGFVHTSTFAEDEYSSAIASESLRSINTTQILEMVNAKGAYIKENLRRIMQDFPDIVKEVRGNGLMLGLEFQKDLGNTSLVIKNLSEQGWMPVLTAGYLLHHHKVRVGPALSSSSTIRIQPSVWVKSKECEKLFKGLREVCEILQKCNTHDLLSFLVPGGKSVDVSNIRDYRPLNDRSGGQEVRTVEREKVCFVGHLIDTSHMYEVDPSLGNFSVTEIEYLMEKVFAVLGPVKYPTQRYQSITGTEMDFQFYGFFINSDIIKKYSSNLADRNRLVEKMADFTRLAEKDNARAMGFGGFNSIYTNNCKKLSSNQLSLTTGNSLTVAMGLNAIIAAAQEQNIELEEAVFAGVGASGNICSIYCQIISNHVQKIILVGKKSQLANLRQLKSKIFHFAAEKVFTNEDGTVLGATLKKSPLFQSIMNESDSLDDFIRNLDEKMETIESEISGMAFIKITDELTDLKQANLILTASSDPQPILFPHMLSESATVVCDIAVPADVHPSLTKFRPNTKVIKGGIVKVPGNEKFQIAGIPLDQGQAYACMSETMLLGLENLSTHYSYGGIEAKKVENIQKIADKHGFKLADFKCENNY